MRFEISDDSLSSASKLVSSSCPVYLDATIVSECYTNSSRHHDAYNYDDLVFNTHHYQLHRIANGRDIAPRLLAGTMAHACTVLATTVNTLIGVSVRRSWRCCYVLFTI